jgi:CheY-like chemotaxis protein
MTGSLPRAEMGWPASWEMPPLVLLVETDLVARLRFANHMLDYGYEVVESESATEALHILESRDDFDAIVVDIHPQRAPAGLSLARYVSQHHSDIAVVTVSSQHAVLSGLETDLTLSAGEIARKDILVREITAVLERLDRPFTGAKVELPLFQEQS